MFRIPPVHELLLRFLTDRLGAVPGHRTRFTVDAIFLASLPSPSRWFDGSELVAGFTATSKLASSLSNFTKTTEKARKLQEKSENQETTTKGEKQSNYLVAIFKRKELPAICQPFAIASKAVRAETGDLHNASHLVANGKPFEVERSFYHVARSKSLIVGPGLRAGSFNPTSTPLISLYLTYPTHVSERAHQVRTTVQSHVVNRTIF